MGVLIIVQGGVQLRIPQIDCQLQMNISTSCCKFRVTAGAFGTDGRAVPSRFYTSQQQGQQQQQGREEFFKRQRRAALDVSHSLGGWLGWQRGEGHESCGTRGRGGRHGWRRRRGEAGGGRMMARALREDGMFGDETIGAERGEGFATFRSKGPLHVDVDFLNDRMQKTGLERIRFAMKPDEEFGLIYLWDNVIADTRSLRLKAWRQLAEEEALPWPPPPLLLTKISSVGPEQAIRDVLRWSEDASRVAQLRSRLSAIYLQKLKEVRSPRPGVEEWLKALASAGVPCGISSSLDRITLMAALDRMQLLPFFKAFVTSEDGMESLAHRFLSAAVKLDRAPSRCVVFEDDPRGITAAHNCSMKAVAIIGAHPAYELKQADLAVGSFSELSVINLRRLFANKGTEFMELQKQVEDKKPRRRRFTTDTLY